MMWSSSLLVHFVCFAFLIGGCAAAMAGGQRTYTSYTKQRGATTDRGEGIEQKKMQEQMMKARPILHSVVHWPATVYFSYIFGSDTKLLYTVLRGRNGVAHIGPQ